MVDVGQIFGDNIEAAAARIPVLEKVGTVWLEEPFHTSALDAYAALSRRSRSNSRVAKAPTIFT